MRRSGDGARAGTAWRGVAAGAAAVLAFALAGLGASPAQAGDCSFTYHGHVP